MTAAEMAQGRPFVVDADADAGDVLRSMTEHRVQRMPVIDAHRRRPADARLRVRRPACR
ncbi:MAG TPA: CBS domain-containing protein [Jiangellales bacterium]|nr:CBS domain-containing protein [Jiangellales bacterium]